MGIGLLLGAGGTAQAVPASVSIASVKSSQEAQTQYQQAQSLIRLGNSRSAIQPLKTAIDLYRRAGDPVGEHNSLIELSFAHYRLDRKSVV